MRPGGDGASDRAGNLPEKWQESKAENPLRPQNNLAPDHALKKFGSGSLCRQPRRQCTASCAASRGCHFFKFFGGEAGGAAGIFAAELLAGMLPGGSRKHSSSWTDWAKCGPIAGGSCRQLAGTCGDLRGTCGGLAGNLQATCRTCAATCRTCAATCRRLAGDLQATCSDLQATCRERRTTSD